MAVSLPSLVYKVKPCDNVGTALNDLKEGKEYPVYEEGKGFTGTLKARTPVPKWHKVALRRILEDDEIVKFGYPIGVAVIDIEPGTVVHVTNVVLDSNLDFHQLVREGFVLGETLTRVERGEALRIGRNFKPKHPALRNTPPRMKIGIAATSIAEGGTVRLGNIVDVRARPWHNERYMRLVRDFYRFLRAGLLNFARVQVG